MGEGGGSLIAGESCSSRLKQDNYNVLVDATSPPALVARGTRLGWTGANRISPVSEEIKPRAPPPLRYTVLR